MVSSSHMDSQDPLLTVTPKSIEALERLRDSYSGLLSRAALMEVDQAVLMAVQFTLKQMRDAHIDHSPDFSAGA